MKSKLLYIVLILMMLLCVSCKDDKQKKTDVLETKKGSIVFTDVNKSEIEEYAKDEKNIFYFWANELTGKNRREVFENVFNGKVNEELYLASGVIVIKAKDLIELKPVDGFNIELKEYRQENYIITKEYIHKCEAKEDTVKIFLNLETINEKLANASDVEYTKYQNEFLQQLVDEFDLEVDHIVNDDMSVDGNYVVVKVKKEKYLSLYNDNRIYGMVRFIRNEEVMGNVGYSRPIIFNEMIINSPIVWREK